MSMLFWDREEKNPNLILFVHGLKGGKDTWSYSKDVSFPSLIKDDPELLKYDVACFDYFTTFTTTYGVAKGIFQKMFKSKKAFKKNLPIQELAELLSTEIKINLNEYENIVLVAHSMGGLISKACILKQLEENQVTSVTGFISLAVPHSGAKIANIGGLVSKNIQLKDLELLSGPIHEFTNKWINAPTTPDSKYIYAAHDLYVDKKSALAIGSSKQDSIAVDEDHSSICKPENSQQTIYKTVKRYVIEFCEKAKEELSVKEFIDNSQYDDEYFVLKMLVADVHADITGHAKEYFYNAEIMRKIFTSDNDRIALEKLYTRIKHLYQEEYESCIANGKTSDEFIYAVHSRIKDEDEGYLNFVSDGFDSIHKKGMLHQLANKNDRKIIWSKDTPQNDLKEIKDELSK